ncbi:hypothetical protein HZS_6706 [Henneguya salminicola]|nr:hypothetical protein HZS_6706 [Henneguya salminicola]
MLIGNEIFLLFLKNSILISSVFFVSDWMRETFLAYFKRVFAATRSMQVPDRHFSQDQRMCKTFHIEP